MKEVSALSEEILGEVGKVVVGKRDFLTKVLLGMLANSHILIEDYPGLAKTLTAKTFAQTLGLRFSRIQFTPDLLPADITGTYVFNQKTAEFELRRGPVFANIILADEINRSPPRTQSALLEAMQERQVTLEGKPHRLDDPFIVIATQNPIEFEGVYPLPEAQVDRFIMKLRIGYPSLEEEVEILRRRIFRRSDDPRVQTVVDAKRFIEMQEAIEDVHVDDDVLAYIGEIVQATRKHPQVEVGASPRGSLALLKLSRASAAVEGRDYVIPDDVKKVAIPALSHRLIVRSELWVKGVDPSAILEEVLSKVPVPKVK